ncbi:MAG: HRDC domain-containing protein [Nocardioidaceae bacterium]
MTTQGGLDAAVARIAGGSGPVAVDAERASGYRYSQRAYLVQLRRAGAGSAIIDPAPFGAVPNTSLAALSDEVDDEWVIHAASQDLPCLAELGLAPQRVFDTELAGRLLNYPRVALGVLVEQLLGYSMRKEHSAVDWSKRPMPESWLRYAALDVEMLVELRDALAAQLDESGKADWAHQEFTWLATRTPPAARSEPWRRTSGIHRVRGRRGLALVRAMWEQRDALARGRDTSPSRILKDAAIIEAASAAPFSRDELAKLSGFRSRNGQRHLRQFHAAIRAAQALADAELPALSRAYDGPPPPRTWAAKHPVAADRLGRCRAAIVTLAEQYDVPQENLLAPDAVRRLAWEPPDPVTPESVAAALAAADARAWQVASTTQCLSDALQVSSA